MKKLLIISLSFLLINCSKIIGSMFDKDNKTDFAIKSYGISKNTVVVEIPRVDHTPIKTLSSVGDYFFGYYIYRSEISPYEGYTLIGFDTRPDYNNSYSEDYYTGKYSGSSEISLNGDSSPARFMDNCTGGKIYYYRVVVGYKKYNGTAFESELKEKGISSWTASICPTEILFQP